MKTIIRTVMFISVLALVGAACDSETDSPGNTDPTIPTNPTNPTDPTQPTDPTDPADCSCDNIQCGKNACDIVCGTCVGGQVCDEGTCVDPGTAPKDPTDPTDPVNNGDCSLTGFSPANQKAEMNPADGPANFFRYSASSSAQEPSDEFQIQSYLDFGGPQAAGTYKLAGSNFADCGLCLIAFKNCTANGCEKTFFADAGEVNITNFGTKGGEKFTGNLNGVIFREVTIDPNSYKSTPVPGGETWCMNGYSFDVTVGGGSGGPSNPPQGGGNVPAGADPAVCGGDNLGTMVGSSIGNFKLQNCNGDWVNLHSLCGQKAVHIMGTAVWCGACSQTLDQLAGFFGGTISPDSIAAKTPGLSMMVVLSENGSGGAPSLQTCKQYAQARKIDPSILFVDNNPAGVQVPLVDPPGYAVKLEGFATLYSFINPYLKAQGNSVSMGVPWNAVLKGENMQYHWSDYYDQSIYFDTAINQVMSQ